MGQWKVELKIRAMKDVPHMAKDNMSTFEWQPYGSEKWYTIKRDNLGFKPNDTIETQQQIGKIFNALKTGLEVVVHASYHRSTKRLIVHMHNGGGF